MTVREQLRALSVSMVSWGVGFRTILAFNTERQSLSEFDYSLALRADLSDEWS
jgi:hypothetical protein